MDNKFIIKFSGDTTQLANAVQRANDTVTGFANKVKQMGGALVAGFAVQRVAEFALSISKLAGEAEGVRAAFNKLPEATKLMMELKEATGNTVSELELMKRAVMASNFGISLKALPQLLEFATVRAKQTGQSVDYLVDSIVTGIGRKSKLILDNLGISAVQLNEALGGTSTAAASIGQVAEAVGAIASKSLEQMGKASDNASTKLDKLNASWENYKVALGNAANGTGFLAGATDALTGSLNMASDANISFWQKLVAFAGGPAALAQQAIENYRMQLKKVSDDEAEHAIVVSATTKYMDIYHGSLERFIESEKKLPRYQAIINEWQARINEADKKKVTAIENILNLTEKLNALQTDQQTLTGAALANTNREIAAIEKKIKALKELGLAERASVKARDLETVSKSPLNQEATKIKGSAANPQLGSFAMGDKLMQPIVDMQEKIKAATDKANKSLLEQREVMIQNAVEIANAASAIGDNIGQVITGQQTLQQGVARSVVAIIDLLEKRALAAIVANAALTGGNPAVALALAAAGFAAIKALFSKIGGGSGGGGGGGSVGAGGTAQGRVSDKYKMQPVEITLQGELTASGNGLKLALERENYKRGVRG